MSAPVIALEGLPGAGKTAVLAMAKDWPGVVVVPELLVSAQEVEAFTREDFVQHDAKKHRLAFELASREGVTSCLMDRSWLSVGAYRYGIGDDTELRTQPMDGLPLPDHYIYLRIPASASLVRRSDASGIWRDETVAQRALDYYDHRFDHDGFPVTIINADRPLQDVIKDVRTLLEQTRR